MTDNDFFFSAINEESEVKRKKINEELEKYRTSELEKAKAEAGSRYGEIIAEGEKEIEKQAAGGLGKDKIKAKTELCGLRQSVLESVFSDVEKKLAEFKKTPDYENYLVSSVKNILKEIDGADVIIYLSPEDEKYSDKLLSLSPSVISAETDGKIKFGGVYGISDEKHLRLDKTFDSSLLSERENFIENSGLTY